MYFFNSLSPLAPQVLNNHVGHAFKVVRDLDGCVSNVFKQLPPSVQENTTLESIIDLETFILNHLKEFKISYLNEMDEQREWQRYREGIKRDGNTTFIPKSSNVVPIKEEINERQLDLERFKTLVLENTPIVNKISILFFSAFDTVETFKQIMDNTITNQNEHFDYSSQLAYLLYYVDLQRSIIAFSYASSLSNRHEWKAKYFDFMFDIIQCGYKEINLNLIHKVYSNAELLVQEFGDSFSDDDWDSMMFSFARGGFGDSIREAPWILLITYMIEFRLVNRNIDLSPHLLERSVNLIMNEVKDDIFEYDFAEYYPQHLYRALQSVEKLNERQPLGDEVMKYVNLYKKHLDEFIKKLEP